MTLTGLNRSHAGTKPATTSEESVLRPWRDHLAPGHHLVAADLLAGGTLVAQWARRWHEAPGASLWFDARSPRPGRSPATSSTDGWWTAGQFDDATRSVAERLQGAGLVPGDRVVWSTSSTVTALAAHVGALRAGLVVVPMNTGYSEREVSYIVGDVRPAAAILERSDQADWVRGASRGPVLVVGPEVDLPEGAGGLLDAAAPGDPALIGYTSGTTGAPKGAVLSHGNLLAATEAVRIAWRWNADDRLVHCLPVFHAHGLCVGVYGTLLSGGSAVLLPGFDPGAVADTADVHRATLFFGVPTMYHRLLSAGRLSELAGLRLCVSGSAPLSQALHADVSRAIGSSVLERYGMTETLMNVSNPYDGDRRAGTVGYPLPGVEVVLAADGEILVRGPNVFAGYWERPESNRESFSPATHGGADWFHTGDLGSDEDGYLAIRGRSKELIISGGFNVYPTEVEDVLVAHPGVAEAAVSGTPSEEWGEVVTAWIVAEGDPPTLDDLVEFASTALASYKRPRVLHVVDHLPRNALGKVVRGQLGP